MKNLIEQIKLKADSIPTNTKEGRRVKGAYVDCLVMLREASESFPINGRSEILLSFFLWFRENGTKHVDKSIEEMIGVYEKEIDLLVKTDSLESNVTLGLFSKFGWEIKTDKEQIYGSCADIYAEINCDGVKYFFIIDDGNCCNELADALYHIYAYDLNGKIFEGRIRTAEDFVDVMRVLGFDKR